MKYTSSVYRKGKVLILSSLLVCLSVIGCSAKYNHTPPSWVFWASGHGIILKTDDGGRNWKVLRNPSGDTCSYHVSAVDNLVAWVIDYRRESIFKTENGGKSWTEQYHDKNICIDSIYAVDKKTAWAAGCRRIRRKRVSSDNSFPH